MGLKYLVFKSGERRFGNEDWAIKHASKDAGDRQNLEDNYRSLLKSFGLPPEVRTQSDGSPETHINGTGLFMLKAGNGYVYVGFVFPGRDNAGRRNTSSVVCMLGREVVAKGEPIDVVARIWSANDIRAIAGNMDERQDQLNMGSKIKDDAEMPWLPKSTEWPTTEYGLIQINGVLKRLPRVRKEQVDGPPSGGGGGVNGTLLPVDRKWIAIAAGIGISVFIAIIGMGIFGTNEDLISKEGTVKPIEQVQTPPAVPTLTNVPVVTAEGDSQPETPVQITLNKDLKDAIKDSIIKKIGSDSQVKVRVDKKYFRIKLTEGSSVDDIKRSIRSIGATDELIDEIEEYKEGNFDAYVCFWCKGIDETELKDIEENRTNLDQCLDAFLSQF